MSNTHARLVEQIHRMLTAIVNGSITALVFQAAIVKTLRSTRELTYLKRILAEAAIKEFYRTEIISLCPNEDFDAKAREFASGLVKLCENGNVPVETATRLVILSIENAFEIMSTFEGKPPCPEDGLPLDQKLLATE